MQGVHKLKIAILRNPCFQKIRWEITTGIPHSVSHFPKKQSHRPNIRRRHFFKSLASERIAREKVLRRGVKKSWFARKDGLGGFFRGFADRTGVCTAEIADTTESIWLDLKLKITTCFFEDLGSETRVGKPDSGSKRSRMKSRADYSSQSI